MEPQIQYAKTSDGVSIAFTTLGKGAAFVSMPAIPFGSFRLQLQHDALAERIAEKRMYVTYDNRGSGMSDRKVTDFSLEAHLLDLRAVVECLGLDQFALRASFDSGPIAIAYAARHPEQVSHLVLWAAWASASEVWSERRYAAMQALRLSGDWELYTETVAAIMGFPTREEAQAAAAELRESVTEEVNTAIREATKEFDVAPLLPEVKAPTLVLHPTGVSWMPAEIGRRLASRIPNSRLMMIDAGVMAIGESLEAARTAVDEFLGEGETTTVETPEVSTFRTILFTDIEGSTALTDRVGDAKARELLREHERITREALAAHGGSEVKTMGDGFMASFSSATKALECAIAMQRAFAEHNEQAEEPINVRIGLNAGEPIAEDEDLFGASVNRAARIAAMAEGGEILAANVVRELAEGKEFMFGDRGETALRGFDDPVRLFELRWREDG